MKLFEELIGNEKLKATAASDIFMSRPGHAYILEGPALSGRHTAARLIASAILCKRENNDRFPCGECLPCKKVKEGISPDVITIGRGGKASIGIDVIRDLKASLTFAPVESDYKIYIIEDADKMTVQAQNSLLLSLEEPPEFVVFILISTDSTALLETVRSRAPVIKMELFSADFISDNLMNSAPRDKVRAASSCSGGALGKAKALLSEKDPEEFRDEELCREILPALLGGSLDERLSLLKKFPSKREDAVKFLMTLDTALRDIVCAKKSQTAPLMFFADRESIAPLLSLSPMRRLIKLSDSISDAISKISSNVSIQPVLMLLLSEN